MDTAPCTAAVGTVVDTAKSPITVVTGGTPLWGPHTIGNSVINKTGSAPHCTDTALHTAGSCVIMAGSAPHCTDTALHTDGSCVIMAGGTVRHAAGGHVTMISAGHNVLVLQPSSPFS